MQAIFYQISKRSNSTKLPTGGRAFEITLKAPCTIIDPEIKIATESNPTGYNYCNIPIFGRYYWIKNWTYSDARWIASLTVDTLASYRAQISSATEYVVRSSAKYDGNIVDSLYPTKAPITTKTVKASTTPFSDDPEGNVGFFVVAVNAPGYVSFGGAIYLAMSGTTFQKLMAALLQNTDYLNISSEEISSNLTKALFNPIQYISKAFWIPCGNAGIGTPISEIPVGWWKMPNVGNAYVIANNNDKQVFTFSIVTPHHPQLSTRGAYTDGPRIRNIRYTVRRSARSN